MFTKLPVVLRDHALSESLLSGCIPHLDFDEFPVDDDGLFEKVKADGGFGRTSRSSEAQSRRQRGFPDARFPNHDDFHRLPFLIMGRSLGK